MFKFAILVGSIISFFIGCMVFLVGIGAIAGCVGGILSILAGGVISVLSLCATISFFIPNRSEELKFNGSIDLFKNKNGQWTAA